MSRPGSVVDFDGRTIVLSGSPDAPPATPAQPADVRPTRPPCPTPARDQAQNPGSGVPGSGLPPPEERARLTRDVGAILRRERVGRGWTLAELADASGLSLSMLWRLQHGRRRPTPATTRKLAAALRSEQYHPVDAAVLDLELQAAAGESLRRVERRRPMGQKRARVYAEARAVLARQRPNPQADVQAGMMLVMLEAAAAWARRQEVSS